MIKCIPRGKDGRILMENELKEPVKEKLSNLPVDPLGGFFIGDYTTRGRYFAHRTAFYRSLWNYTMINKMEEKRRATKANITRILEKRSSTK
ncbi:MAG: hypothetical protein LUG96_02245 [Tannerellaceae bacterium]|nr:hypothetical protein [Tannerellaceae bacterium]MCD7914190.1 hypothetical protein [Tannerellaceae bacterium]